VGKAFIKLVDVAQSIKPGGLEAGASVFRRIWVARTGKPHKVVLTTLKTTSLVFDATNDYLQAFADDLVIQTSTAISKAIDDNFHPQTARFLKATWGRQQLAELAAANGWVIAQDVMTAVSIVDITGVTGVVNAYAKPVCQDITLFPCVAAMTSYPGCGSAVSSSGTGIIGEEIVWQFSNGLVHYWSMRNGQRTGGYDISSQIPSAYSLKGVGDVDGDGTDDIVWQHNSGQVHYWRMSKGTRLSAHNISTPVASGVAIKGIGNVNQSVDL
jgi:hypothetical protein